MYLIYLDESGDTGVNLSDPLQPIFVLCAMVVAEEQWQALESDLKAILAAGCPRYMATPHFEIHGSDLRRGTGAFKGVSVADRIALRDALMTAGKKRGVKLLHRSISKKAYAAWLVRTFGQGVIIHPYIAAFALLARGIDEYLASMPGAALGTLIMDENKQVAADVEKSIKIFREVTGPLRCDRIVEKGFFIESHKSLMLQLCDLFTLSLRKRREASLLKNEKTFDKSGIEIAASLLYVDTDKHRDDAMAWLSEMTKKQRPGD